ncbi:MAG: hypothetical protein CEO21_396 [Microgenomates group bacterium Gr01-1014_80]|nr:MAG: hypothetical protein CEO21_396 [Microgenomates group bacterium Gr01-1014_80]
MDIKTKTNLTCPFCGQVQEVTMPETGCQYRYRCQKCGRIITANKGDCCVFCSYADTKCPPKQMEAMDKYV